MYRDSEKQLKSALRDGEIVDTYLYLCKVYVKLDQPLTAIEVYLKVMMTLHDIIHCGDSIHFQRIENSNTYYTRLC